MTTQLQRRLLWTTLILSAVANAVATAGDRHPFTGIGFGVVTLACVIALLWQHRRRRHASAGSGTPEQAGRDIS